MAIEPIKISMLSRTGKTGRPKSDRITELEHMINNAVVNGRVSVEVELLEDETSTLFRSRARAAGKRAGRAIRASVDGNKGLMVITTDEVDE